MDVIVYGFGAMGKKIINKVNENKELNLIGVVSIEFDQEIDANTYSSLCECEDKADIIIDFSNPNNLEDILNYALKNNTKLVLGTTGYSENQLKMIEDASNKLAIFQSYNTSFGIQMMTKILRIITKEMYNSGFDIEIVEKHHNRKVDAPSGTAKLLYEVINEEVPQTNSVLDRSSLHEPRKHSDVGIQAMRAGTIFGEHEILFGGNDELIEIKHTALSREVFVLGAINAALSLTKKDAGLYTLKNLY